MLMLMLQVKLGICTVQAPAGSLTFGGNACGDQQRRTVRERWQEFHRRDTLVVVAKVGHADVRALARSGSGKRESG